MTDFLFTTGTCEHAYLDAEAFSVNALHVRIEGTVVITTERYRIAIVGGGVIGLACARDLALAGVEKVVLIEREAALGQGSTARANGGVRAQFTTRANIEFSHFTISELEKLELQCGGGCGFQQVGYLLLTGTAEGESALRAAYQLQLRCGIDVDWLSPAEVLSRAPSCGPRACALGPSPLATVSLIPTASRPYSRGACARVRSRFVLAVRSGESPRRTTAFCSRRIQARSRRDGSSTPRVPTQQSWRHVLR